MGESDHVDQMFAERVSNALEWFEHARALIGTARLAKEHANLLVSPTEKWQLENVCSMLYGLALENLFKATWINHKFGPPYAKDWLPIAEFPKQLKTHDLNALAKMIGCELDQKKALSLKLLSDAVAWSGRYPCSIRGDEGARIHMPSIHEDAEAFYAEYRRPFTISS